MNLYCFKCSIVLLMHALHNPLDGIQCCSQLRVACIFTHMHEKNWTQYLFPGYALRASLIGLLVQHC